MSRRAGQRVCTADEAVAEIPSDVTLATGGFVGAAHPEALTAALERRFLETGGPRNLTLLFGAGQGDGKQRGLNHLAHAGLLKRVIAGHLGLAPKIGRMALDGTIEACNLPQGVLCQLLRDIAAGRPGLVTHVGLDTFVDPRHGGGRLNERTPPGFVERIELRGREWLFYPTFPIHVGLIRATAADPFGNLVMDEEALLGEGLPIAQAVRNSRGLLIAQVKRLLDKPVRPVHVRVPGVLVDRIVVAEPEHHQLTFAEADNPAYYSAIGDAAPDASRKTTLLRRIIGSRACDELTPGTLVNLGIGMPEAIAEIAGERQLLETVTLTLESGPIGGRPAGGLSFGASAYPQAIIDQPAMFDLYDGGGLDFAALGAAQVDAQGNVNVSKFHDRLAGSGGFINISQSTRRLVFCGSLTSCGLEVSVAGGRLQIDREGSERKFVEQVEQVTFSGRRARESGCDVLYVTERAVFRLNSDGLELIEVAPGIDVQRDVLPQLGFAPKVGAVREWPPRVLADALAFRD
ncbi:MAG: acyl CoA:acetate/3-ketoacid CoA transferase [Planctomycetaceae bacterium]|nr:acyl CoA:acetate/3-ketoacid CoA transferase [Planctomycetaceae bacterium]